MDCLAVSPRWGYQPRARSSKQALTGSGMSVRRPQLNGWRSVRHPLKGGVWSFCVTEAICGTLANRLAHAIDGLDSDRWRAIAPVGYVPEDVGRPALSPAFAGGLRPLLCYRARCRSAGRTPGERPSGRWRARQVRPARRQARRRDRRIARSPRSDFAKREQVLADLVL